jgi:pimeloyl-ACP methyl ester carboxylesterase
VPTSILSLSDGRRLELVEGGDPGGVPVFIHHGTPGGPLLGPAWDNDGRERGLRLVLAARPGYASSTRAPGRSVRDVASDVAEVADRLGIERFLTWGWSGGGPHALACAALLPDRVVAAASLAGVAPYDADGLDFMAGMGEGNIEEFGLTVEGGEAAIRPLLEGQAHELLDAGPEQFVEAMAPHLTEVDAAEMQGPFGEVVHAQTLAGLAQGADGWIDDNLAFVRPWGVDLVGIRVPVQVWQGRNDAMVPYAHGEWLAARIIGADARLSEDDGHLTLVTRQLPAMHQWLRERWDAAAV